MLYANFAKSDLINRLIDMKALANQKNFHSSLWAGRGQNTVCPWQL